MAPWAISPAPPAPRATPPGPTRSIDRHGPDRLTLTILSDHPAPDGSSQDPPCRTFDLRNPYRGVAVGGRLRRHLRNVICGGQTVISCSIAILLLHLRRHLRRVTCGGHRRDLRNRFCGGREREDEDRPGTLAGRDDPVRGQRPQSSVKRVGRHGLLAPLPELAVDLWLDLAEGHAQAHRPSGP